MRVNNLLVLALALIILFPICFSAEYFRGISTNDLNHDFFIDGFVYQAPRNNYFTSTGTLDRNVIGKTILTSNGDDYINTGVIPDTTSTKRTHMQVYGRFTRTNVSQWFGKWGETGVFSKFAFGIASGNWLAAKANSNPYIVPADTALHLFDYNYDGLWVDGNIVVDLSGISGNGASSIPIYLYAAKAESSIVSYSHFEMHYAKIFDNGILIRNFVPQENGCLFDLVYSVEYCNEGVGDLATSTVADISEDVIAYYKFDSFSGTTIYDTARNRTATLSNGGTISAQGMWDSNALSLDGVNDYVGLTNFYIPPKFSISAWLKPTDVTSQRIWLGSYDENNNFYFGFENNNYLIGIGNIIDNNFTPSVNPIIGYNHYVVIFDGLIAKIYQNGNLEGTIEGIDFLAPSTIPRIGAKNGASVTYYKGLIDELKIYNIVLTGEEIIADYNSFLESKFIADENSIINGVTPRVWQSIKVNEKTFFDFGTELGGEGKELSSETSSLFDDDLVGLWHLNGNALDSSGNGFNGTNSGVNLDANGLFGTSAGEFDGDSSGIILNNFPQVFNDSLTFSVWAFVDDTTRGVLLGSYSTANNINFEKTSSNHLRIFWNNGQRDVYSPAGVFAINKWNLLTFVRDKVANEFRFYVNGALVGTVADVGSDITPAGPFYIGKDVRTGATVFDGKIEEVVLWSRGLSSSEVSELYNLGASRFHGQTILALWHLNNDALDSSGNEFHGDWNGTPSYTTGLWDTNAGDFSGTTGKAINVSGISSSASVETISFWAKTSNWSRNGNIFNSGDLSFSVGTHGGDPTCGSNRLVLSGFGSGFGATAPPVDEWVHIVVLRGAIGVRKIYYNGVEQENVTCTGWGTYAGSVIGARRPESINTYFLGQLEDLTLFTKRLTENEIIDLYRKGATRLDLNVYSCSDASCATKTSSQYLEGVGNNTQTNLSVSDSIYFGYEAFFKSINELSSASAGTFFVNSFLSDVTVEAISANNAPTISLNKLENYSLSSTLPYFSKESDGDLNFNFNIRDLDNDRLLLTVRFSTTTTQGSGTTIITDLNLDSTYCESENFSTLTNCSVDLNTLLVSDGNYYLLAEISDTFASPVSTSSTNKFGIDNTAPIVDATGFVNDWQRGKASVSIDCEDALTGCSLTYYRYYLVGKNPAEWINYTSDFVISGDGNYQLDINSVDAKENWNNLNTYFVPIGFDGELKSYNDLNKPQSFFGNGEIVRFVYDVNLETVPSIHITDSSGEVIVSSAMQNISQDTLFGNSDLNTYYYDFVVSGQTGFFDINVENQLFEKHIYNSVEWQNNFTDSVGLIYPFTFDINVIEPNVLQRWFAPIDTNVSFITPATISSIKVLDYNGTTYKEIPSQLYEINYSGELVSSGRLVFLSSFDINQTKQFFINYSVINIDSNNYFDINTSLNNSIINISNSFFDAYFDINKGGLLQKINSKIGSNIDFNSESQLQQAPASYSRNNHLVSTTNVQELQLNNSSLVSSINISGDISSVFDYNINYLSYAKNPFIIFDSNLSYLSISPSTINNYFDNDLYLKNSLFENYFYHNNNFIDNSLQNNGASSIFNDLNLFSIYNNKTLDAFGIIYENAVSNKSLINKTTSYDLLSDFGLTRSIFSDNSIIAGDYFFTRNYYFVFNPLNEVSDLNRIFLSIKNPVQITVGTTQPNDFSQPTINSSASYLPSDANDVSDINCFASFDDDILITNVLVSITGPNLNISEVQTFNTASAFASYLISSQSINSGDFNCSFTATDLAGFTVSSETNFFVSDYSPPEIIDVSYSPDTNAGIDPDTNLLFDIKINEYTGINSALLFYRKLIDGNWSDWNSSILINDINYSDTNYGFDGNLQLSEGTWQFFINATDVNGLDSNSEIYEVYAYLDYTWVSSPASFGNVPGLLGENISVGTITIENTGDANLNYRIKSNWDNKYEIFYDSEPETSAGYQTTIDSNSNKTIIVTLKAKTTERSDALTITVDAINTLASPDFNTITATILSLSDGPFLLIEWDDYDSLVTQGDNGVLFSAVITNLGNADANTVILDWNYPSDWVVSSGEETTIPFTLVQGSAVINQITFNIGSSASTGSKDVSISATCCNLPDKTQSLSSTTTVLAATPTDVPDSPSGGSTGGGTGGGSGGGASGGSIFSPSQQSLFFQTSEFFEIVRGQDNRFRIRFTNPLEGKLVDVNFSVSGIISSYLKLQNSHISSLDTNNSFNTFIEIVSPKYFSPGEYELTFNISGFFEGDYNRLISFGEERKIILLVHDTNKEVALNYLNDINLFIESLNSNDFVLNNLPVLLTDANKLFYLRNYDGVKENYILAKGVYDDILLAKSRETGITGLVGLANSKGIETPGTNRLLLLAQLAFSRGDYALALSRLKEAELVYSLETKGEFNVFVWILANFDRVLLMLGLLLIAAYLFNVGARLLFVNKKLKDLASENKLLLGLIAGIQKRCFIENKISIGEYYDSLEQFESRIAKVSEDIIDFTARRNNTLRFTSSIVRLGQEKEELLSLIKETQKQYFDLGLIETRIYETKIKSLTKRLAEVSEAIVFHELQKTQRLNMGVKKYFWRGVYKIKK